MIWLRIQLKVRSFRCIALAVCLGGWIGFGTVEGATALSYTRDVRPILAEHCFACHGQDDKARKGGLRLDLRNIALVGGKSGKPALQPGNPEGSELIARITSQDADVRMPPPEAKKPLSGAEIEILRQWVGSGAEYQPHWSFIEPVRPNLPTLQAPRLGLDPGSPIDAFVRARLEWEDLKPAPDADRPALLRRLSLDLTGLPPSPRELESYLNDSAPDAYSKQVDRLLASPHFGERWAQWWLDAARYSDSDGYEKDLPRQQWAWRDWVIQALNRDLPYDHFVIEQIAGDLLPNATQDQRTATGFLRNSMVNEEGAIIAEQFRTEGLIDRMDCLGKAVLGLTLQCAQCHSHKFDPLTQEEYYRIFAFLNNDFESIGRVYSPEQLKSIDRINRGIADEEAALKAMQPDWPKRLSDWVARQRPPVANWEPLDATDQILEGGLAHPEELPDHSIITLGFRPSSGDLRVFGRTSRTNLTGLRLEAMTHGDLAFGGPGRSSPGTFAVSEMILETRPVGSTNAWVKVGLTNATADFAETDHALVASLKPDATEDKRRLGPARYLIDGNEETAWSADRGLGRRHTDYEAVVQLAPTNTPFTGAGVELRVTLQFRHAGPGSGQNNFLGRFRISFTDEPTPVADPLPRRVRTALAKSAEDRTPAERAAIFSIWRSVSPEAKESNGRIEALWREFPEGDTVLNLAQRPPDLARETSLLERGSWQKPGRKITAGTPAFLHPLPAGARSSRLTLGRWLVDRRSPTTARVIVNRVWQAYFGLGLVETPEDFGLRAPLPTHPELLDWLAVEFMEPVTQKSPDEQPWSLKHLHRLIVNSATYRQSAKLDPGLMARDPVNRLLARGPRFRAEAEMIRDVALSAAGLLHERVGGPSFYPPVPESMFAFNYTKIAWPTATGAERYRRSLYQFRRRSMPDPVLGGFDAPNGDSACVRRVRSNTPLAALTGLNEPIFVEASRALALRTLREAKPTESDRIEYAFRLCTGRVPRPAEITLIHDLLKSRQQRIADGWVPAKEIAFTDPGSIEQLPAGTNPTEAAAWAIVSRVLLNLDETLTK